MTDLIDTRNVGAISALTRAMANAIAPSNVGGASLQLQDLRITFAAPPPVAVLLGTADARVLRRQWQSSRSWRLLRRAAAGRQVPNECLVRFDEQKLRFKIHDASRDRADALANLPPPGQGGFRESGMWPFRQQYGI
jgi:hypothetical protein